LSRYYNTETGEVVDYDNTKDSWGITINNHICPHRFYDTDVCIGIHSDCRIPENRINSVCVKETCPIRW